MDEFAGEEVPVVWRGRRVRAFVPLALAARDLTLAEPTVAATARAAAEVSLAATRIEGEMEPLARLVRRSEGVASSFIEGVRAPVVDVVLAEFGLNRRSDAAAWVAANLAAVDEGVASSGVPLAVEALCRWHATLMGDSPLPRRYVGAVRTEVGWIGGTDPTNAALVTAPPETISPLLDDLIAFANRADVDPVAQAALAHAQFETIHPFGDGNGRVGRVLVAWILARRMNLTVPPPVSVAIATDVGGYLAGLARFRLHDHDGWVRWFADAVRRSGVAQRELAASVDELRIAWQRRLDDPVPRTLRQDSSARRVLELLPAHLVITSDVVEDALSITNKAALAALHELAARGVLIQYGTLDQGRGGRPAQLYVSAELLGLAGSSPLR